MALKLIAFASLCEYVFIKPWIISESRDGTDFIGYCLAMAVFAFFGKINLENLAPEQRPRAFWNGVFGGVCGYAWLLLHVKRETRQIHHLLVANLAILAGVLFGTWQQKRKKGSALGGSTSNGRKYGSGYGNGNGGSGFKTSKDLDYMGLKKGGCCGMMNGMPVDD